MLEMAHTGDLQTMGKIMENANDLVHCQLLCGPTELFFSLSNIMDFRHQSSAMCTIMLGGGGVEKTQTRGLQRK